LKEYKKSLEIAEKVYEKRKELYGEENPKTVFTL
jgi:hypothetical protein